MSASSSQRAVTGLLVHMHACMHGLMGLMGLLTLLAGHGAALTTCLCHGQQLGSFTGAADALRGTACLPARTPLWARQPRGQCQA